MHDPRLVRPMTSIAAAPTADAASSPDMCAVADRLWSSLDPTQHPPQLDGLWRA